MAYGLILLKSQTSTKQSPAPPVARIFLLGFHLEKKISPLCSLITLMEEPLDAKGMKFGFESDCWGFYTGYKGVRASIEVLTWRCPSGFECEVMT